MPMTLTLRKSPWPMTISSTDSIPHTPRKQTNERKRHHIKHRLPPRHHRTQRYAETHGICKTGGNTITLLAPTGSGKTVAFAIALLKSLGPADGRIRAVVMAPSRELVLQIFDVIRPIATRLQDSRFLRRTLHAGRKNSLSVTPDIIIATPGRLLDHITRGLVDLSGVRTLVLDEYDKALELGFADEMKRVCKNSHLSAS